MIIISSLIEREKNVFFVILAAFQKARIGPGDLQTANKRAITIASPNWPKINRGVLRNQNSPCDKLLNSVAVGLRVCLIVALGGIHNPGANLKVERQILVFAMSHWAILSLCLILSVTWAETAKPVPTELKDQFLFCEACYATITEVTEMMIQSRGTTLKKRIKNALDSVCSTDHLRKYILSPPKMAKVRKRALWQLTNLESTFIGSLNSTLHLLAGLLRSLEDVAFWTRAITPRAISWRQNV